MKTRGIWKAAALVAAAASATLGLVGVPGTSALLPVGDLIDLTVDIEALPGTQIAPAGEAGVVYRIEAKNVGLEHLGLTTEKAVVTGTLPAGFTLVDAGGCTVTVPSYSCSVTTFPQTFDIALTTADSATDYTALATAVIKSKGILEPIEFVDNNDDSVTITVWPTLNSSQETKTHVCPGCTVSYYDAEVGSATITDPGSENGFFVTLRQNDRFTGQGYEPALEIYFDEDAEGYQVEDPTNPVRVRYVPVQGPCYGIGADCAPLGMFDPSPKFGMLEPERLQDCDGGGPPMRPGIGQAFVENEYRVCRNSTFKSGSVVGHEVLMKTKDPLLPPLSL